MQHQEINPDLASKLESGGYGFIYCNCIEKRKNKKIVFGVGEGSGDRRQNLSLRALDFHDFHDTLFPTFQHHLHVGGAGCSCKYQPTKETCIEQWYW